MKRSPTPESVRCAARGTLFRGSLRSAFSLIELLVVILILGVLYGGVALAPSSIFLDSSSPESVRCETERAASWLQRVFYKALLSGRGFAVRVAHLQSQRRIVVHWVSPVEDEVYDAEGRAFFINHSSQSSLCQFTPKWNILTPALTIRVSASEGPRRTAKALWYIVVSPYGRVSLRDTSP